MVALAEGHGGGYKRRNSDSPRLEQMYGDGHFAGGIDTSTNDLELPEHQILKVYADDARVRAHSYDSATASGPLEDGE